MTTPLRKDEITAVKRALAIAEKSDDGAVPKESTARPLGNWLADPEMLRQPEIIIPHLIVEGRVSLLSGREKIGKSTLAAGAVAAASHGSDVLGVRLLDPIRTLWYAIDEPVADAVRRFSQVGADPDGVIINAEPRSFSELLTALERDLEAFDDVGAVVLDTLSRVLAVSGVDPNSSKEVEPVIAQLVDVFHRLNVGALLHYHTGKGGKEYRGSTAIGATVDEVLTLRRRGLQSDEDDFNEDNSDDGRRLLVQDGRNLRSRVHLTFTNGVYRLYEDSALPRDRIMEQLRLVGSVGSRNELAKLVPVRRKVALEAIAELIGSGLIAETSNRLRPGSAEFPDAGTAKEPAQEPTGNCGSHTQRVGVSETGTEFDEAVL